MKIEKVSVECWKNEGSTSHIARCARVCYASDGNKNEALLKRLKESGHTSMFRHDTRYYIIPNCATSKIKFPEVSYVNFEHTKENTYVSVNGDWLLHHRRMDKYLQKYEVEESEIVNSPGYMVVRRTFVVDTQISTSRELNRTSPNNIAEQSTRYVDFEKKGGIRIAEPYWYNSLSGFRKFVARVFWKIDEIAYNLFKRWGLKPEEAREFLPLVSHTRVVYTYSLKEWGHILNLRYWGTTGKPHPNAKNVASKIREILINEGFSVFENPVLEKR